jgi:putative ABC transport system permease protein
VNINEYWLRTDGADLDSLQVLSREDPHLTLVDADGVRRAMKSDPMALGLRSVTTFGFIITAMLSLIGFATYFYISARQRETNYGILRSIGLAPNQLYISLVLEQVVLIFFGLALGTGLGVLINLMTLSGLPINLGEQGSVPPFIPYSDWNMVGKLYAALVISFMATLGIATVLLWRSKIHRALRIGEE